MKKYLAVCAALFLLHCFPLFSQEADGSGAGAGLTIIPRLDLEGVLPVGGSGGSLELGNSSLYSLFEGNITPWLSFSVANHWLSANPAELYVIEGEGANLFRSDWTNWLDWAYLSFDFGNFSVSAGKDMITTGGFEFDEYDWDVHPALMSGLWNNFSCYQWGGKVAWTSDGENTSVSLQYTSSPYCERPFGDGPILGSALSLAWRGEYGPYRNIWSVTALGAEMASDGGPGHLPLLACLGNRLDAGDFTFGFDWYSMSGSPVSILSDGGTFLASIGYTPSEKWEFLLKGGRETASWSESLILEDGSSYSFRKGDNWFGGASLHWFPAPNLRLHAAAGYSSFTKTTTALVGLLYYLNFNFGR